MAANTLNSSTFSFLKNTSAGTKKKATTTEKTSRPERSRYPAICVGRPPAGSNTGWDPSRAFTTSQVFDKEQYNKVCDVAYHECVSRKEMLYRLIKLGLEAYERGGR